MKKYEFIGTTKMEYRDGVNHIMKQIVAVRDIPRHNVKEGDVGSWLSTNSELSQEGDAWINKGTHVFDSSISGDVLISESVIVDSKINGSGLISYSSIHSSEFIETGFDIQTQSILTRITAEDVTLKAWETELENIGIRHSYVDIEFSILKSLGKAPFVILMDDEKQNVFTPFTLRESQLFISTDNPDHARIHHRTRIKHVIVPVKNPLTMLVGFEKFSWRYLDLQNMGFHYGHPLPMEDVEFSSLSGEIGENLLLENGYIQSRNSRIKGDLRITGILFLEDSKIYDCASVINHSEKGLHLRNVNVTEMAKIVKVSHELKILQDREYNGDILVRLD